MRSQKLVSSCVILGGFLVGFGLSFALYSQINKPSHPETSALPDPPTASPPGYKQQILATRELAHINKIERVYTYPQLRISQLNLLVNRPTQDFFQYYTQSPILRLNWLAALACVVPQEAAVYNHRAIEALLESNSASTLVSSALCFGHLNKHLLRPSSSAQLRGVLRFHLATDSLQSDQLEFNSILPIKALTLEAARLSPSAYQKLSWTASYYLKTAQQNSDFSPLGPIAAVDAAVAFAVCAEIQNPDAYHAATLGITSGEFSGWLERSLPAMEAGWLKDEQMKLPILRWTVYSPNELNSWLQRIQNPIIQTSSLQNQAGYTFAIAHWDNLKGLDFSRLSKDYCSGLIRGLSEIDASLAIKFVEARSAASPAELTTEDHSALASALSYTEPVAAAEHYTRYVAANVLKFGSQGQNFDAQRTSERVFNALADIDPAAAISVANQLPQNARGSALLQLFKILLLKQDQQSSDQVLHMLRIQDDGAFRSAVGQGYGMQVPWDILENHKIDYQLKLVLQRTGKMLQGDMLPRSVK